MKNIFGNLFASRGKGTKESIENRLLPEEDLEEQQFNCDFRKSLLALETALHKEEDYEAIIMTAIRSAYDFYDADWAGILTADPGTQMWSATRWISRKTGANVETLFDDEEYYENYPDWVHSLRSGEAIVIEDVSKLADSNQTEIDRYKKLEVTGVMGAPYGLRPSGFMVVKNPRRYRNNPDYLKMMAFVGLSSYYQQVMMEGMKLMSEGVPTDESVEEGRIRITLFGVPEIITAAGRLNEKLYRSVPGWKIITYLIIKNRQVSSREFATTFWPDEDPEAKMGAVRNLVYRFREKATFLGPMPIILRDDYGYLLNPELGITSDVAEFDAIWKEINTTSAEEKKIILIRRAMELYKGKIYEEYADEEWLMIDATSFESHYIQMVNMLLEILAGRGEWHEVHEIATMSLKVVSGNSVASYWRIEALIKMGATKPARAELEAVRTLLAEEEYLILSAKLKKSE